MFYMAKSPNPLYTLYTAKTPTTHQPLLSRRSFSEGGTHAKKTFKIAPLHRKPRFATIRGDVDLRIGIVVMRRMSFALSGGKRFPPLLF